MYVFVEHVVRWDSRGSAISLRCVKETADYFGWSTAFPEYIKSYNDFHDRPSREVTDLRRRRIHRGGRRHRICRDPSKKGMPAGKTNCFRIVGNWRKKDLAQLAKVAGDKFEWMEGFWGERISREDWLDRAS